jgi:hypothetical protein
MRIAFYWCTPLDGNNLRKRKWRLINLNFEQSKWIVKCCSKTENVTEVQRRWKNEFLEFLEFGVKFKLHVPLATIQKSNNQSFARRCQQ